MIYNDIENSLTLIVAKFMSFRKQNTLTEIEDEKNISNALASSAPLDNFSSSGILKYNILIIIYT